MTTFMMNKQEIQIEIDQIRKLVGNIDSSKNAHEEMVYHLTKEIKIHQRRLEDLVADLCEIKEKEDGSGV